MSQPRASNPLAVLITVTLLVLTAPLAAQERSQQFGDFTLHYNAVPTVDLDPEIARRYQIPRSQRRGLITVSLVREGDPVAAAVNARSRNLAGQVQAIRLREIREGEAVYYIGTYSAVEKEELEFTISAQPKGAEAGPFEVVFEHTFFGQD
jgi:hypothetical protein